MARHPNLSCTFYNCRNLNLHFILTIIAIYSNLSDMRKSNPRSSKRYLSPSPSEKWRRNVRKFGEPKITSGGHIFPRNKNTAITQALSSWWQPGYYRAWNVSMMSHCAVQIAAKSGCLRGDVPPRKRISFTLDARTRDTKFRFVALLSAILLISICLPIFIPASKRKRWTCWLFFPLFFPFLLSARGEDTSCRDTCVNKSAWSKK